MPRIAAAVLLFFLLPLAAHAQHDDRPNARARPLFEAGRDAYVAGRYREAAEAFERVFAMTGHPFMLRNLGNAYEKLGEREKAIAALHQYLRLLPEADDRAEIEARAQALEASAAEPAPVASAIATKPAVTKPVASTPAPRKLTEDPTPPAVAAKPAALELRAPELDEVPAPPPAPATASIAARGAERDTSLLAGRTFTWVALGASAAFAATAGLLWAGAHGDYDKLALGCGAHGGCSDRELDKVSHAVTATNVMLGLSSAALVSAIVLFFVEDESSNAGAQSAQLLPSVDRRGATLSYRGSL